MRGAGLVGEPGTSSPGRCRRTHPAVVRSASTSSMVKPFFFSGVPLLLRLMTFHVPDPTRRTTEPLSAMWVVLHRASGGSERGKGFCLVRRGRMLRVAIGSASGASLAGNRRS